MKWIALCLSLSLAPVMADDLRYAHDKWVKERDVEVAGPEGWMALVGMHWLAPGHYDLGSGAGNDIVLPKGPESLGSLTVSGSEIQFQAIADGDPPLIDGQPTMSAALVVDIAGSDHSVISVESLRLFVVMRGALALRVRDLESPGRLNYTGIPSFDYDPSWRIKARFDRHPDGRTIDYLDAKGYPRTSANPGRVVFERDGETFFLEAASEPGERLFLIFADQTNGRETYGAGRFLYAEWPVDDQAVLDFNQAYNPPCVFSEYANCPLPPKGNRLRLAVTAGEKTP